jgi:hypothetical protein
MMQGRMPVTFHTDDSSGVVFTAANGIVSCAELVEHIAAKAALNLQTRAELFDARDITLDLSLSELQVVANRTKEALRSQPPGKVAVVTNSAFVYGLARAYSSITREDNPHLKIFQSVEEAHAWLLS